MKIFLLVCTLLLFSSCTMDNGVNRNYIISHSEVEEVSIEEGEAH